MVIIGVVGATFASRMMPQTTLQLQAGRDLVISAFFMAQQSAMNLNYATQLTVTGDVIDVRMDRNEDSLFSADEVIEVASTAFPLQLRGGINLSGNPFIFDRLGHTSAGTVMLTKGTESVTVTVSGTGYAY